MTEFRAPSDPHCLFCKIVTGALPARFIHQDDHCVAFLDINPVNKGHVLIVPRIHHSDLTFLPVDDASAVASVLPRLSRAVVRATGAHGFNLIVNNGSVAGQTIFHGHWHIIPRFRDDAVNWPWPHSGYSGDELNQVAFSIERELSID